MNRYEWNRALIEPFTRMSLWGIRYDSSAAQEMRSTLVPQAWSAQAKVDELAGVRLPDSTEALLAAVGAAHCHSVKLRTARKGSVTKERVPILNDDGTPKLTKKGKARTKLVKHVEPTKPLTWAILNATACLGGGEAINRLSTLWSGEPLPSVRAEIAALLGVGVNVESPEQVITTLDRLGLPAKYKKGARKDDDAEAGRTSDEESLLDLFISTSHPITKAILEARGIRGALSWLDSTLPSADGRIRCSFANPGSETGRVLTRTWHDRTGGNLQATSIAPWNFRRLLRADDGFLMAQCDLKSADAWTVAARCAQLGDPTLLRDMQAGVRIPSLIALLMEGVSIPSDHAALARLCKTVKKDWRDYAFKKGTYLSFYMGSSALIRRETVRESWAETGTPVDPGKEFCARIQALVLQRYWGLKLWWDWCEREVRRSGTLEGASGQTREFMSRRWTGEGANRRLDHSCHKEVVATEPQMVTTYLDNLALWRLWSDPQNWPNGSVGHPQMTPYVQPLLQVHDSIIAQFHKEHLTAAGRKLNGWFDNAIRIGAITINVPVDCKWGETWGTADQSFPL